MEEELLKLVYKHQEKELENNVEFLESFLEIILQYENLKNYIQKIENTDTTDWIAKYDYGRKAIIVSKEKLKKYIKEMPIYTQDKLERLRLTYAELLIILLHESTHAAHFKKVEDKNDDSLETNILRISYERVYCTKLAKMMIEKGYPKYDILKIIKNIERLHKIYNQFGIFAPEERLAIINSYKKIYTIFSQKEEENSEIIKKAKQNLVGALKYGYIKNKGRIESPTITYLEWVNKETLMLFDWYHEDAKECLRRSKKEIPLELRIKYGLYIEEEEYEKVFKKC